MADRAVHSGRSFRHPTTSFRLGATGTLQQRLATSIRERILEGTLASGARLPSTRALAESLGLSRATVTAAFEQLVAEGYIEARHGSGSYVRREELARPVPTPVESAAPRFVATASVERMLASPSASLRRDGKPRAFRMAVPELSTLPIATWARLSSAVWRRASPSLLSYQDRSGLPALREAIARYLTAERGVRCDASRVLVTNGSQQALRLVAQVMVEPGDDVWMEEPGYYGARAALADAGARVHPIRVDRDGLDVARALRIAPSAKLAYVTPRHQMPLGVALSAPRRLALLSWAAKHDGLIVEDDYDGELLLRGKPLPTLHELDGGRRVFYVGSFSVVLFPGLRIGYLVVPAALVDLFASARAQADLGSGGIDQAVLARFISEGHLHRHVRRMRRTYAERATVLEDEARRLLPGVRLDIGAVGIHAVAWLPRGTDEVALTRVLAANGVEVRPLGVYRARRSSRSGLVLGFGATAPPLLRAGVRAIADALSSPRHSG